MSMPDHIILSDRFYKNFLPRRSLMLLQNGRTGLFCFTRVGEPAHISKISYSFGVEAAWPGGRGNDTP